MNIYKYKEITYKFTDDFFNPFIACYKEKPVNGLVLAKGKNVYREIHVEIYKNGILHNFNGPSIVYSDGSLDYRINGKFIGLNLSNKEFQNKIKKMAFE